MKFLFACLLTSFSIYCGAQVMPTTKLPILVPPSPEVAELSRSELKSAGSSPATVVGAELKGKTSIGTSGSIPGNIAPQLNSAAAKLGGVGTKTASGNTIGCCGEFRSANDLLLRNPSATPAQINFTPAIRPRTGETVPMCDNCKIIFKKKN